MNESNRPTLADAFAAVEEIDRQERATTEAATEAAKAVEAALQTEDPYRDANQSLDRAAAAQSAVDMVMRSQLGLSHPTRLSSWTIKEINRLLDNLYDAPGDEIKLGGQVLGEGFIYQRDPNPFATPNMEEAVMVPTRKVKARMQEDEHEATS